MNYGKASQPNQLSRRPSVSSISSGCLISNEKCENLIYNISTINESQPTGKTKDKKSYDKIIAGNNQNNNFGENFNSSNPTTFLSTSEMGSSDEEIKTKTKKSNTGRNNFRRLSSALLKKPQMYREKFDSIANLSSIKAGHNNVEKGVSFTEKKRNTSKKRGRNNNNEEEDEEEDPVTIAELKTEKIAEEEEEDEDAEIRQKEEKAQEEEEEKKGEEPDPMDLEYLKSLVGGDTARPVELKHYNSTEFISQIVKMRGGWRFNISFSAMEIAGNEDQVEEATAAEQMKQVTSEEKNREKKLKEEIKKNKNQAEFCKGKILNTFNRFVEKWGDEKSKFPEDEDEDDFANEANENCIAKRRKVRFSRYNSVAKKFGECDISLYYSPRRCQM